MKKKNRVRKSQEFQKIIHSRNYLQNASFVLHYVPKKDDEARIGITLTKKIGNAVMRNHYKRQVRMMCEQLIDFNNCGFDAILIVRKNYPGHSFADNKNSLEKLFIKATMIELK